MAAFGFLEYADPLAPEQIERQKRFLRRFARVMLAPSGDATEG